MTGDMLVRDVTDEEIAAYEEDGIVCLRDMFSSDWVKLLREAAEDSMQNPCELHAELAAQRNEKGRFFHDTFVWLRNSSCRNFIFESPAATVTQRYVD